MFNLFNKFFIVIFIIILFISLFFIPIFYSNNSYYDNTFEENIIISESNFFWPIPGYTYISSYFGKRSSPTLGASTYHSGIDIPASNGTNLYAIDDGTITFASWGAGGGYTIVLKLENYQNISVSYCHVSPHFIVSRNQEVKKGELIGYVGPKNVYGITNNPYKDSNGKPTNGATTGSHLHLTIKIDGKAIDPLSLFSTSTQ